MAGVEQIVDTLAQLKFYYGRLPAIRSAALRIVGVVGNNDQAAQVNALAAFVRNGVVYLADPLNTEFIQTPDVLLLQINRAGFVYGDCDDHCLLFGSLCEALGIRCDIVGVNSGAGAPIPDHVITTVYLDAGSLDFDLVAKGMEQPSYGDRVFGSA